MMASSTVFVIYALATLYGKQIPLIIVACISGIAASILYIAMAWYVAAISQPDELGKHNGIFLAIRNSNVIFGNAAAGIFFTYSDKYRVFVGILAVVGFIGVLTFLLLRDPPAQNQRRQFRVETLTETIKMFQSRRMLMMALLALYLGSSPTLTGGKLANRMPKSRLGFAFAIYGGTQLIAGVTMGVVSDIVGRPKTLFLGFLSSSLAIAVSSFVRSNQLWVFFVCYVLFGLGDIVLLTQMFR